MNAIILAAGEGKRLHPLTLTKPKCMVELFGKYNTVDRNYSFLYCLNSKINADKSGYWDNNIVTEITEIVNYSDAEDYHNDYYSNNPNQPYCLFVIKPKLDKLLEKGIIK